MSTNQSTDTMPSFLTIYNAITTAPPPPAGFPLAALNDATYRTMLQTASSFQPFMTELRVEAERARSTSIPTLSFQLFRLFETTGDRSAYEEAYFDRRRRLLALALETAIDDSADNLAALSNLVWAICEETSWALPAHLPVGIDAVQANRLPPDQIIDLFAAHTAHSLAELVALLGDRLDPWLHYRVRDEVERRIFTPLFHHAERFKWEWEPINWAAVCGGCVGMAALILEEDRERLAGMVDRVIRAMECFLEGFGADGGCLEGISYWAYGFGFYTYFADMLATFTGGELNLLQGKHIARIVAFPAAVNLGDEQFVNFSDAPEQVSLHAGLVTYLSEHVPVPLPPPSALSFHTDHIYRWGNVTRDLIWTQTEPPPSAEISTTAILPATGWVIDRRTVDNSLFAFATKAGHNAEPHNHNDLGHFLLHVDGESVLCDLGAGLYTRHYFSDARYEALHTGSQGHSVPLLNGQTQGAGEAFAAELIHATPTAAGVRVEIDLAQAYAASAEIAQFVRRFDWAVDASAREATLTLEDTIAFVGNSAEVEEQFISLIQPTLAEGTVTWQGQRGRVKLTFDEMVFDSAVDILSTHTHSGEAITVYRLRLGVKQPTSQQTIRLQFACRLRNG